MMANRVTIEVRASIQGIDDPNTTTPALEGNTIVEVKDFALLLDDPGEPVALNLESRQKVGKTKPLVRASLGDNALVGELAHAPSQGRSRRFESCNAHCMLWCAQQHAVPSRALN